MTGHQNETLAQSIVEQLNSLTTNGKIKWRLEGQKYTVTYNGLSFEIEDSGQNWLVIGREDGGNRAIIMDTMIVHDVELLLQTIKHGLTPSRPQNDGSADLEEVLDILKKEA